MRTTALYIHRFSRIALMITMLIVVLSSGFACTGSRPSDGGTTTEIPQWLNQVINQLKNEPVANPPASVTIYEYKGELVYYIPPQYADIWSTLYNADGDIIAHPDGGITGNGDGRAQDFFRERSKELVVWADEREYDPDMIKVLAPINNIEISIAESYPQQYFVMVTSGLQNSCVKYGGYYLKRNGDRIVIDMVNWKPADPEIQCAEIYTEVQTNIPLGTDFKSGTKYTIEVNDKTKSFLAQ